MKKLWLPVLATLLILTACGTEKAEVKEEKANSEVASKESEVKDESVQVASLVDSRLQEPQEDTVCEMCNMKVYMKDHEMGVFSAQAIKADGTIAFYDDIGCLVNAEVANNEKNDKFVRDYNTKDWAKVEDVAIVKTDLKSPMNWGYIYFINKADADKYLAENPKAHVEELQKIKDDALERRKKKMQENAEKEANGESDKMNMEEMNHESDDHNH
ncbi:nitrous oxide reductase accessory protein NosL [Lysinibacillus sphaericus]|uniref:nitrous oxide reductase accessory protein NosL n=1 Tax=Lysinibacillus sphaericus TaxID=1421 RepID=UPI0021638CF6|nr:nitrous oxide reductase accessory protein NosL [Lysinibacillus sphaericus]MCS1384468.1 nitrous oxide reductase accessory protein NosL [Lysinibacillus sphaericus]